MTPGLKSLHLEKQPSSTKLHSCLSYPPHSRPGPTAHFVSPPAYSLYCSLLSSPVPIPLMFSLGYLMCLPKNAAPNLPNTCPFFPVYSIRYTFPGNMATALLCASRTEEIYRIIIIWSNNTLCPTAVLVEIETTVSLW